MTGFIETILRCGRRGIRRTHHPDQYTYNWNMILLVLCVMAITLDPLFCYILVVNEEKKCLGLDKTLGAIASILRSVIDLCYMFYIVDQVRASVVDLSSQVLYAGTPTCSLFYFVVDIPVILPFPQVLVLHVIPKLNDLRVFNATTLLNFIFIIQYVLRVARIYFLLKKAIQACEIQFAKYAWANLCFFMLASHVVGSFWYLFSIERKATCWLEVCKNFGVHCYLYCDGTFKTRTYLKDSCSTKSPHSVPFEFGIYSDAIESGVVDSVDFIQRISYCFWWGLQNLSSLGQSLKTSSTYVWEIYFSIFILISGLVLIAALIGTMQTHLLSRISGEEMKRKKKAEEEEMKRKKEAKEEEMKRKKKAAEEETKRLRKVAKLEKIWRSFHSLPQKLKKKIRRWLIYESQEIGDVDAVSVIDNLPEDIKRETIQHLCSGPLSKVKMPQNQDMDQRLFDAIYDKLKPVFYIDNSIIMRMGEPLHEMLFITSGKVWTFTTPGSAGADCLENGDFYGQELLDWVLKNPTPSLSNLPFSMKTVQAHIKVEVFALRVDDLNKVVSKYWWLFHASSDLKQLRETRALQVIQAACRRNVQLQKTPGSKEGSVSAAHHTAVSKTVVSS